MFTKLTSIFLVLFLAGCPISTSTVRNNDIVKWGELPSSNGGKYNVCVKVGQPEIFRCPDYLQD